MQSIDPDYFKNKADELGLERGPQLQTIQKILDQRFPTKVRVMSLNRNVLKLVTPNASMASELRLNQINLLEQFQHQTGVTIDRLQIVISAID
ncbi:MAG TPA: DciA family protein [Candidatus Saccharimonadales bacterium]|nr:DciA family protein [Candidatus Saccharimonadales bacterium]